MRLVVALGAALLGGAVLVAAPPAYAAGTPAITDAYVDQARYAPGTGFVDNFATPNSGVSFTVNATTSGSHNLVLRYGNGGSAATRIVAVDGVQVATPTFPAQGTWDSWVTLSVPVNLTAGLHTVVVWRGSSQTGAINVDNLTVS